VNRKADFFTKRINSNHYHYHGVKAREVTFEKKPDWNKESLPARKFLHLELAQSVSAEYYQVDTGKLRDNHDNRSIGYITHRRQVLSKITRRAHTQIHNTGYCYVMLCLSREVAITACCISPARRHCGLSTKSVWIWIWTQRTIAVWFILYNSS